MTIDNIDWIAYICLFRIIHDIYMLPKTKKLGVSAIIATVGLVIISMIGLNNNLIAVHQPAFAQLHKNQTVTAKLPIF